MKYLGFIITLVLSIELFAQTVQVPEDCLNKISPCLVHTDENFYQFKHSGQTISMVKGTILKISFDRKSSNLEVVDGRISVKKTGKNHNLITLNNQVVKEGWLMANRSGPLLNILDLSDFNYSTYRLTGLNSSAEFGLTKQDFADKNEFVGFTKHYFQNLKEYKKFLAIESRNWKREFQKQNNSQTKVLLRTIASEQEKTRKDAEKKALQAGESKKARDLFFYRTFER